MVLLTPQWLYRQTSLFIKDLHWISLMNDAKENGVALHLHFFCIWRLQQVIPENEGIGNPLKIGTERTLNYYIKAPELPCQHLAKERRPFVNELFFAPRSKLVRATWIITFSRDLLGDATLCKQHFKSALCLPAELSSQDRFLLWIMQPNGFCRSCRTAEEWFEAGSKKAFRKIGRLRKAGFFPAGASGSAMNVSLMLASNSDNCYAAWENILYSSILIKFLEYWSLYRMETAMYGKESTAWDNCLRLLQKY